MNTYDVIVIGGGLLGCFTARNLAKYNMKILLLESREDLCTGISRANTAIVYSGCDTKPNTLKSRMCVKAAQSFGDLCDELNVRYSQCGSIMVCFGPDGEEILKKKFLQGMENGVRGLKLITREEVLKLEPNLSSDVRMGLYAPEAGTVIPWELGLAAAENAIENGVQISLNAKAENIIKTEDGYRISAGGQEYCSRGVINCAGLHSDEIFEKVHRPLIRIFPSSGDYFVLDTKAEGFVRHVIFHEPEEKGKGLTLVPTIDGNILVGPSEVFTDGKDGFETSEDGLNSLSALVEKVIPDLPMEHIIRSFGAKRPNPFYVNYEEGSGTYIREEKSISNFTVLEDDENPAFLSLIGIKTPGLSCAQELGSFVAERMASLLGKEKNPVFNPRRFSPLRLSELSIEERSRLVGENSAYGRIVCRCRKISEGEIIDAIHRIPGAVTVDGVKRRTGACSGRCQGSFCTRRIVEILARELKIPPEVVNKDGPGSYLIGGVSDERV